MVGEVVKIYGDGDIRVAVNGSTWTYNVECVTKTSEPISAVTAPKGAGSDSGKRDVFHHFFLSVY